MSINYTWTQTNSGSKNWISIASSSNGINLVACAFNDYIYTSNDSGITWTQQTSIGSKSWRSIASSSDGINLVACALNNYIYTSNDSGLTWTQRISDITRNWISVASNNSGEKLVACVNNGYIYTSTNYGVSWTEKTSTGIKQWLSVVSNNNGEKLAACFIEANYIYTSTDSGDSWTIRTGFSSDNFKSITSSSDGTILAACAYDNYIYTSIDSGTTWTTNNNSSGVKKWQSITINSDGTILAAGTFNDYIYTSNDSGITWTPQTNNGSKDWRSIASNSDGKKLVAGVYEGYIYTGIQLAPCFLIGSKILTDKGCVPIEQLRKGDLVKTLKNNYLPIILIGKSEIYNSGNLDRIKNRLYNLSKDKYPELTDDLVLTGCHSILVDTLTNNQLIEMGGEEKRLYITDGKLRLFSYLDPKSLPYLKEGTFTIYHITLKNENYYGNYGIYANGLLVESCSERYLTEFSSMVLID